MVVVSAMCPTPLALHPVAAHREARPPSTGPPGASAVADTPESPAEDQDRRDLSDSHTGTVPQSGARRNLSPTGSLFPGVAATSSCSFREKWSKCGQGGQDQDNPSEPLLRYPLERKKANHRTCDDQGRSLYVEGQLLCRDQSETQVEGNLDGVDDAVELRPVPMNPCFLSPVRLSPQSSVDWRKGRRAVSICRV